MLSFWLEPYILFKYGFKKKIGTYLKDYFKFTIVTIILGFIAYYICSLIYFDNIYIQFVAKVIAVFMITNLSFIIIYWNNINFKYYLNFIKKFWTSIKI